MYEGDEGRLSVSKRCAVMNGVIEIVSNGTHNGEQGDGLHDMRLQFG